jgi:hypothetical protein
MARRVRDLVDRHPLGAFLAFTFGISWGVPFLALAAATVLPIEVSLAGYSPLASVAVWAPALAAVAVVRLTGGSLAGLAGLALLRLTQGPVEELGWRGLALALLQRRHPGLGAAVILGAIWALWHAPALVVSTAEFSRDGGTLGVDLLRLFVGLIATSVAATVLFNGSGGSVPLAVLLHWLTNVPYPWEARGAGIPITQDVLTVVAAVLVAVTVGRRYLGHDRDRLATGVLPDDVVDVGTEPQTGASTAGGE